MPRLIPLRSADLSCSYRPCRQDRVRDDAVESGDFNGPYGEDGSLLRLWIGIVTGIGTATFNYEMGTNSKQLSEVVDWLNGLFLTLRIPADASEEDLRRHLADGSVLCAILRTLNPDLIPEGNLNLEPETQKNVDSLQFAGFSLKQKRENVKKFLLAVDDLGLPKFELSDLEQAL
ncbi:Kinesin-4 [Nymphaea thermarum]|nr:Kinesin-4 [Nymphaea thermarum]